MKKCLLFFILFSSVSFGDVEERRNKILKLIDAELEEITRIVKQTRGRDPNFVLRLAELYFEQARLIREKETESYMRLSEEQRRTANKNTYFVQSQGLFLKAQKTTQFLLQKYPNYKDKGDAYYIMAKNAMEFQDLKKADTYFNMAYKNSGGNQELQDKAGVSVAENLYNNKKYTEAIRYYEKSLTSKQDKWWTKDAYNLAWCYYRTKQTDKAIKLMHEIHRMSIKGDYVNMAPQVEDDLAFFYTSAGRVDEVVAFYQELKVDIPSKFLKVARTLEDGGKFLEAEKLLIQAIRLNPKSDQEAEIYAALLGNYEKSGKVEKHLNACKKLLMFKKAGKLSSETLETLNAQSERFASILQNQVTAKTYASRPDIRRRKALIVIEYYKILLETDPKNSDKWNFYAGETLYAAGLYTEAIPFYYAGNIAAKENRNSKISEQTAVGLLSSLDKKNVNQALRDRYTMTAFKLYLESDPKSEKASKIYQRIFSAYMGRKSLPEAEKTLMDFKANFPSDSKVQEGMVGQIIDYYKKVKNYPEVEKWAKRVADGEFNVSSQYTGQVRLQFVSTKLEKIEGAANKGEAIEGYLEIFNNSVATRESRVNAAYNISTIYFELEDADKTFQWVDKALSLMGPSEKLKYATSYQAIGKDFFGRRQFDRAQSIYEKVLNGICSQKSSIKDDLYLEIGYLEISDKNYSEAHAKIEKYKNCGIPSATVDSLRGELLDDLVRNQEFSRFDQFVRGYQNDVSMIPYLVGSLGEQRKSYLRAGLLDKADEVKATIYEIYRRGQKAKVNFSSDARDIYAMLEMENLKREVQRMSAVGLGFPEAVFQKSFKDKYALMDSVLNIANRIISLGSSKANMTAYRYMVFAYRNFVETVNGVVPEGKPKEYVVSFKQNMAGITGPFSKQADSLERKAKIILAKEDVLTKENFYFLGLNISNFTIEYDYSKGGIPMDKGGGR